MKTAYLGIDCGKSGAVALIVPGQAPYFWDTPVVAIERNGKPRREYVPTDMLQILREAKMISERAGKDLTAGIEAATAFKQGATSALSTGYGMGLWIGMLSALDIPTERVQPATWKKAILGKPGQPKGAAILKAVELFPGCGQELTRVKDHNRADALLIALFLQRRNGSV